MQSMMEGASDSSFHIRRKNFVAARAPSTILLRKMVPLPPLRGGGRIAPRFEDAREHT
jgi:hypothetical protein